MWTGVNPGQNRPPSTDTYKHRNIHTALTLSHTVDTSVCLEMVSALL